jgi:hypothetical protein
MSLDNFLLDFFSDLSGKPKWNFTAANFVTDSRDSVGRHYASAEDSYEVVQLLMLDNGRGASL